jgi:hypothetical protein
MFKITVLHFPSLQKLYYKPQQQGGWGANVHGDAVAENARLTGAVFASGEAGGCDGGVMFKKISKKIRLDIEDFLLVLFGCSLLVIGFVLLFFNLLSQHTG